MKASGPAFRWLVRHLESKGFRVVKYDPQWIRRTNSDVAKDFLGFYEKHKTAKNFALGFSYGAVVALLTANLAGLDKLYLCSLSPDFKEDTKQMDKRMRKEIGVRRLKDTESRSAKALAKALKMPAVIFYGEKEGQKYPELKKRAEETVKLAKKAKLVVIPDAPHKIDFPAYQSAIKKFI